MNDLALRLDNVGKRYRIGSRVQRADTLVGAAAQLVKAPLRSFRALRALSSFDDDHADDVLWALRDVSFDIQHGEAVGLIGRNGAGKSTLLKILSRITEPTTGSIAVHGRIASLLEVGTGFNDELTGRENAYLNGAILGMTRAEVDRKFDEIVAFSEIEAFIDTPVKRYSSGMKVRLAFAVAAHLEPEILLVDEVLAVGDVAFQRKCLGKMDDVSSEGRTVVFVSHHMSMIQALCRRGVVLGGGQVTFDGGVDEAVGEYLRQMERTAEDPFGDNPERTGGTGTRLVQAVLRNASGEPSEFLVAGEDAFLDLSFVNEGVGPLEAVFTIYSAMGAGIATIHFDLTHFEPDETQSEGTYRCHIPRLPLLTGGYRIALALRQNRDQVDHIPAALRFQVSSSVFYPTGKVPSGKNAVIMLDHAWSQLPVEEPFAA